MAAVKDAVVVVVDDDDDNDDEMSVCTYRWRIPSPSLLFSSSKASVAEG